MSQAQQAHEEDLARRAAQAKQFEQMRPGPGELPLRRPGEVPTGGPLVDPGAVYGQNPYTDPPPMGLRRFYEDPKPPGTAPEQTILQGRGAIPPYPPLEPPQRVWDPRRYPDQMDVPRPSDSPQPSEWEANASLTFAQFLALPLEQQDRILSQAREHASIGRVPEYHPTRDTIEAEDRAREEAEKAEVERQRTALQMAPTVHTSTVPTLGAAVPGTVTAAHPPELEEEHKPRGHDDKPPAGKHPEPDPKKK